MGVTQTQKTALRNLVLAVLAALSVFAGAFLGADQAAPPSPPPAASPEQVVHAQVKFEDCGELAGLVGQALEDCMLDKVPTPPPTVPAAESTTTTAVAPAPQPPVATTTTTKVDVPD